MDGRKVITNWEEPDWTTYRGRDKMSLVEFIEDVESCHFRTGHDTGANPCALMVWNSLRSYAGLERLTQDDLIRRHAETDGKTFEEMKEDYRKFDEWRREYLR